MIELKSKLHESETNKRARKIILFKLSNQQLDFFMRALHNRTIKDKRAIHKFEINRLLSHYEKTKTQCKNHNGSIDKKLNAVCKVKIKPIDLSKYKKNIRLYLFAQATTSHSRVHNIQLK